MDMGAFSDFQLSPLQRILILWAFVAIGLVIAVQVSQAHEERPLRWTKLTGETRPYWYTIYVLEALLLVQSVHPILVQKMEGYAFGHEEKLLNGIWIGLLSLEALMVVGVAVRGLMARFSAKPKQKTT